MDAVVDCWIVGLVVSEAVTVLPPAVLRVTLKVLVPEARGAPLGGAVLASLVVMPTVSFTVLTTFPLWSTALTVTLNAVPAVCAVGVPVLPLAVPGAAGCPGARGWEFANGPGLAGVGGVGCGGVELLVRLLAVRAGAPRVVTLTRMAR